MTELELIRRSVELLGGAAEKNPWFAREGAVKLAVKYAMHALAKKIAANPALRHHLQNNYEVTIASGSADLTSAVAVPDVSTYGAPMAEFACYNTLLDADNNRYTYLAQYRDLLAEQPAAFGYYALVGQAMKVREISSGDLSASATFTYIASFVPTVAQLRTEIEDDAVLEMSRILTSSLPDDAAY